MGARRSADGARAWRCGDGALLLGPRCDHEPLLAVLNPGDELLVPDSVYGPTRRFCDGFLKRFGVATRYYDPLISSGIGEIIGETTRAILLESPGSLTMEVQDVPGICAVARERGIVTLLDNTWATPLLFPAIAAGVDITIMAATKYVGGHADVMLGTATATPEHFRPAPAGQLAPRPRCFARRCLARLARLKDDGRSPEATRRERS